MRVVNENKEKPTCNDPSHGCNKREFSTFSNLLRHQREKNGQNQKSRCTRCGAEFTRSTAMKGMGSPSFVFDRFSDTSQVIWMETSARRKEVVLHPHNHVEPPTFYAHVIFHLIPFTSHLSFRHKFASTGAYTMNHLEHHNIAAIRFCSGLILRRPKFRSFGPFQSQFQGLSLGYFFSYLSF